MSRKAFSRFGGCFVLAGIVIVTAGWTWGSSEQPSGPPSEEEVRVAVGADQIQHLRCKEVGDERGGYVCVYRTDQARTLIGNPSDYLVSRLTWENGSWKASAE